MGTVFINGKKHIWKHDVRKVRSPGCPLQGFPGESPQSRVGEQPVVVKSGRSYSRMRFHSKWLWYTEPGIGTGITLDTIDSNANSLCDQDMLANSMGLTLRYIQLLLHKVIFKLRHQHNNFGLWAELGLNHRGRWDWIGPIRYKLNQFSDKPIHCFMISKSDFLE